MVLYITNWFRGFAPKAGAELIEPFINSGLGDRGNRGNFGRSRNGFSGSRGGHGNRCSFEGEDDFGELRGGHSQFHGGYGVRSVAWQLRRES